MISNLRSECGGLTSVITSQTPPDYFAGGGWELCSGPSLRGHIVRAHLTANSLANYGLPLYDIEIAQARGFGLGWVVRKAVEKLDRSDQEVAAELKAHCVDHNTDPAAYRIKLIKTIALISKLDLANVPWKDLDRIYPGASDIGVDLTTDHHDLSFFEEQRRSPERMFERTIAPENPTPIYLASLLQHLIDGRAEARNLDPSYSVNLG